MVMKTTISAKTMMKMNSNTDIGALVPVDRAGRPFIASSYGERDDIELPQPGVFGDRDHVENSVGYIARDEYSGQLVMGYPDTPLGEYGEADACDAYGEVGEVGEIAFGEVGEAPGAGLATQCGPFPAWVWLVGIGTVAAFWLAPRR